MTQHGCAASSDETAVLASLGGNAGQVPCGSDEARGESAAGAALLR